MRLLKVFILVVFLVSTVPLGAFCHDTHQDAKADHGHCVLMCNAMCSHATAADQKIIAMSVTPVVSSVLSVIDFSYQNPSLDILKRPPVIFA